MEQGNTLGNILAQGVLGLFVLGLVFLFLRNARYLLTPLFLFLAGPFRPHHSAENEDSSMDARDQTPHGDKGVEDSGR